MVDQRCPKCRFSGYTADLGRTCDYLVITGRSRTAGLTAYEKAGPCKAFEPGSRKRIVVGIDFSRNGRYIYDQQKIRKLYFQGLNDKEISEQVGCTRHAIWSWRHRHNLEPNRIPGKQKQEGLE